MCESSNVNRVRVRSLELHTRLVPKRPCMARCIG
jgi:hypothetical protein